MENKKANDGDLTERRLISDKPLSEADLARARSVVAAHAKDEADRALLMEMLGLDE